MKLSGLKDPASALTHLIGGLVTAIGLAILVYKGIHYGTVWHVVSFTVYGVSLLLMYTFSTLYHALSLSPKATLALRKVDHMMIFNLIAGTYTPFCLLPLRGAWGWSLFGAIWGCAILGMLVKLFWMNAPRWLSTGFYLLMGWLVIVAIHPLFQSGALTSLIWLLVGGLLYTVGAVVYALKWPAAWPGKFGFHEIWHLFVTVQKS